MTALSADVQRLQKLHDHQKIALGVNAGSVIYEGALVCREAATALAIPGADTASLVFMGVATKGYDNTDGADGVVTEGLTGSARYCEVDTQGHYLFATSESPKPGDLATILDDNTVSIAATTTNDIVCGTFVQPGPSGYWYVDIERRA